MGQIYSPVYGCRYVWLYLRQKSYAKTLERPSGWTHVVLNWNGAAGLDFYYNGEEEDVGPPTPGSDPPRPDSDGRVVVGRTYTDIDTAYSSIMLDELLFFNYKLNSDQIQMLYNIN